MKPSAWNSNEEENLADSATPSEHHQDSSPPRNSKGRVGQSAILELCAAGESYTLEQVFLSLGRDYQIRNTMGEQIYFVDGKVLSPIRRMSFQDTAGNELALIRDKFLALRSRFEVLRDGQVAAAVRQRFWNIAWIKHTVQLSDGEKLETRQSTAGNTCLCRGDLPVMHIRPNSESLTIRTSAVTIHTSEDQVLMLAIAVAIIEFTRLSKPECA